MEHRKRALSSVLDEDSPIDLEKQIPRRRGTSASIDDDIEQYSNYMYTGTFNLTKYVFTGFIKLIFDIIYCNCCDRYSEKS